MKLFTMIDRWHLWDMQYISCTLQYHRNCSCIVCCCATDWDAKQVQVRHNSIVLRWTECQFESRQKSLILFESSSRWIPWYYRYVPCWSWNAV